MGCSAAKNVTVEQIDLKEPNSNGAAVTDKSNNHTINSTIPTSITPIEADDIPEDVLENTVNNLQKGANGLSFEIKFDENEDNDKNIIEKHPPKRILELQESQSSPLTLKKLQEKLDEAEIRRQQILQQRVQSATLRKPFANQHSSSISSENDHAESPHHLKVPPEKGPHPPNPYDIAYV